MPYALLLQSPCIRWQETFSLGLQTFLFSRGLPSNTLSPHTPHSSRSNCVHGRGIWTLFKHITWYFPGGKGRGILERLLESFGAPGPSPCSWNHREKITPVVFPPKMMPGVSSSIHLSWFSFENIRRCGLLSCYQSQPLLLSNIRANFLIASSC